MRRYQLVLGAMPQYLELVRTKILTWSAEKINKPLGFWTPEIGHANQVVHLG